MSQGTESSSTIDFASLANPYDFAKPVTKPERFAGRASELADITYYLALAKQTSEPMNLAIIGDRASGKTSMLNIIDINAREVGLVTARVNLNTADAAPANFFWKLYDAVVDAYSAAGYLFSPGSDEDMTYRRIVDALDPTADSPNFPLRFPSHYAFTVNGGKQISEVKLQRDLDYIYQQANVSCVIIFDECNVLTQDRVTLEMLRNVFMNISGYMIVLTGTPSFFPMLDEVFSPIIRQFKKINVRPFKEFEETRQCVYNPLRSLSIDPASVISVNALFDIHAISHGRPYEIQLLCHFMFRRLQDQRATKMQINVDVMDDVLNELEANISDPVERPIVAAARYMTERQLNAVGVFLRANDYGDLNLAWFMNEISTTAGQFTRDELGVLYAQLQELRVFGSEETENIHFNGDDFDRIYLKYYAERLGLSIDIEDYPGELNLSILLRNALTDIGLNSTMGFFGPISLEKAIADLLSLPNGDLREASIQGVKPILDAMDSGAIEVAEITINFEGKSAHSSVWTPNTGEYGLTASPSYVAFQELIQSNGGTITQRSTVFDLPDQELFIANLLASPDRRLKEQLGDIFTAEAIGAYMAGDDDATLKLVRQAVLFPLSFGTLSNLGYMYLALGLYDEAKEIAARAAAEAEEKKDFKTAALSFYNLAMCEVAKHDKEQAVIALGRARHALDTGSKENFYLQCLFVPVTNDQGIVLEEMWEPQLSASIAIAQDIVTNAENLDTVRLKRKPNVSPGS